MQLWAMIEIEIMWNLFDDSTAPHSFRSIHFDLPVVDGVVHAIQLKSIFWIRILRIRTFTSLLATCIVWLRLNYIACDRILASISRNFREFMVEFELNFKSENSIHCEKTVSFTNKLWSTSFCKFRIFLFILWLRFHLQNYFIYSFATKRNTTKPMRWTFNRSCCLNWKLPLFRMTCVGSVQFFFSFTSINSFQCNSICKFWFMLLNVKSIHRFINCKIWICLLCKDFFKLKVSNRFPIMFQLHSYMIPVIMNSKW